MVSEDSEDKQNLFIKVAKDFKACRVSAVCPSPVTIGYPSSLPEGMI
jgi:hypothetical protein